MFGTVPECRHSSVMRCNCEGGISAVATVCTPLSLGLCEMWLSYLSPCFKYVQPPIAIDLIGVYRPARVSVGTPGVR